MLGPHLIFACCVIATHASITNYIGRSDELRFFPTLMTTFTNLTKNDMSSVYYGAKGFTFFNEPLPTAAKLNACKHLETSFNDNFNSEATFHALSAWSLLTCDKAIGKIGLKLHKPNTIIRLKAILDKSESTVSDIRYALEALKVINEVIPTPTKITQHLQTRLKEDDSLLNIGMALHAAYHLDSAGQFANQYVEDVVVQADEVDGRLMQWEGGLTVTGLLLSGLLRLPGTKPFTQSQADKFATYLLTRKTVQGAKGIISLIDAASALCESSVSPVSITFADSAQVTIEKPDLKIRISNILGKPLKPAPTPVIAQSATRVTDDVVVLSKQPLNSGADTTEFILPLRLDPGQYRVGITAGSHSAALMVRILGPVIMQWLEVGLGDADGSSTPRLTKLQHPSKLPSILEADSSQHLILRFSLSRTVHQPFLRLSSGKREIIFVAELDNSKAYKIDVNLASELTYSAVFELELILGDSIMSNPLRWSFGSINVKLSQSDIKQPILRGPKPEIKHMFRPAEKRPPQMVSMLFSVLAGSPLLLLLILWLKLGLNFNNFSVGAFPFHIGLASIFGLFTCFWLRLDMFTTCAWLIPLGLFTFLSGHRVLSKLAKQKK